MAYRSTDVSTTMQIIVCVRYINEYSTGILEVCKEFIRFCSVPTIDAETFTAALVAFTNRCGLKMEKLVGK